jgi:hypothetical protein
MPFIECAICLKVRPCERHHIVPAELGGIELRPLCTSCHDMVDRIPLNQWDPNEAARGMKNLWSALDADGRLYVLKLLKVAISGAATIADLEVKLSTAAAHSR